MRDLALLDVVREQHESDSEKSEITQIRFHEHGRSVTLMLADTEDDCNPCSKN